MPTIAPYGSWTSPITSDRLVEQVVGLSHPLVRDGVAYWLESRPAEGGRVAIVRRALGGGGEGGGEAEDVIAAPVSARTQVHEYGGLCYAVHGTSVYYSDFADQRLYRIDLGDGSSRGEPEPITGEPLVARSVRFAVPVVSPDGRWIYCVRERHPSPDVAADVVNDIVAVATDGSAREGELPVVASGHDFYAHVTLSPDGRRLAWISWDHPNMPWDATELWECELEAGVVPTGVRRIAGRADVSVTEPKYSPDGRLHYVSDETGWWNLYVVGKPEPLVAAAAEFAQPDWVFGMFRYSFLDDGSLVASPTSGGIDRLARLRLGAADLEDLPTNLSSFEYLSSSGDVVLAVAGSPTEPRSVVRISPDGSIEALKAGRAHVAPEQYLSVPSPIEFPIEDGLTAHGLFYAPTNPDFEGPEGTLPPLIVRSHGGPTSSASTGLNYEVQFWTSRGFAVVDVDYGGSAGYGREYRRRLNGSWGIVDLDDCVSAAKHLAAEGLVDGARLLIHGGSAGGFTTLCALTFREVFAAGASYYGVADLGALARDTHKFELRYCDGLVGPWPDAEAVYRERSPGFHTDLLKTPMILFQGLDDKVVPPAQAEEMAAALRDKGVPFAYLAYDGEGHGFRQAKNIKRTAEAELYFYGKVLGFEPADDIDPVEIENAGALAGR